MDTKAEIPLEKMITSQIVSMFRGLVITKEIEEEREREEIGAQGQRAFMTGICYRHSGTPTTTTRILCRKQGSAKR